MHRFGDQLINTDHVHAIGLPEYDDYSFFVRIFFVGGTLACFFDKRVPEEYISEPDPYTCGKFHRWGLRLMNEEITWNAANQSTLYPLFHESVIYDRMKKEIAILSAIIEKPPKANVK